MKLTAIILLTACLAASARGLTQTVSLSVKNASLEKVFAEIKKQTGYSFVYNNSLVAGTKKISLTVSRATVDEVLQLALKDQLLTYEIVDKTIVVKPKNPNDPGVIPGHDPESFPPIDITGRVTDADGNPLSGANVKVKGTSKGTTTNADGVFVLKGVDDNAMLEISFVGFETYTVAVSNKTTIVASLKIKPENLDEIVINKGYYTEKQKLSTGNTFSVKAKDIEKQPVNNPLLALVGRVPGVTIEQSTGFANSGIVVRIQGRNSINSGLDPLYVIDGVPYNTLVMPTIGTARGTLGDRGDNNTGAGNPLSLINPNDIESIDILKDADATAIYGSRGANGVILITTKKGKAGQTRINANFRSGWGQVNNKLNLLNTQDYLMIRKEGYTNGGAVIPVPSSTPSNDNYDLTVWDQNRYTDWQKVLIGGTSKYTDGQLALSGGSANTQFLIGAGFHKETTVFPGDFSDQKGSFQFNINHSSANSKFKMQTSGLYVIDNNQLPSVDLTSLAMQLAPNAPKLYNPDGSLNWEPVTIGSGTVSTWINPVAYLYQKYRNKAVNLIASYQLNYQLFKNLNISSRFGYNNVQYDELYINPILAVRPERRATTNRFANFNNGNSNGWSFEPQATYEFKLGKGRIDALIGSSFQRSTSKNQPVFGQGFSSDLLLGNLSAAPSVTANAVTYAEYKYNALFGRLNYNFLDRYIINATARRDGSSRFGPANLFNNFWSIAGSWIFTNDNWLSSKLRFLNFGKLRVSYGTSGNEQIGEYGFMNLYNPVSAGVAYQGITALAPNALTNPYLAWEETKKLQVGLDLGLLKDRVYISSNYYHNRSSNLLTNGALSIVAGFAGIKQNFDGVVENSGWEFAMNTVNIRAKDFSWSMGINLTIPHHNGQLISFPNLANTQYANTYIVGKSLYDRRAYHFIGVDPATGTYQFQDSHGNPTISPTTPQDVIGFNNTSQTLYGGMQNTFLFKQFELGFSLQGVKRRALNYWGIQNVQFNGTGDYGNQLALVLDRWKKPGDIGKFQRTDATGSDPNTSKGYSSFLSSDGQLEDASFLRMTNMSFSWQLPGKLMKPAHLQNAKLFIQGQNLFTVTKFEGLDPSTGSSFTLPPLRIITLGVNATF